MSATAYVTQIRPAARRTRVAPSMPVSTPPKRFPFANLRFPEPTGRPHREAVGLTGSMAWGVAFFGERVVPAR